MISDANIPSVNIAQYNSLVESNSSYYVAKKVPTKSATTVSTKGYYELSPYTNTVTYGQRRAEWKLEQQLAEVEQFSLRIKISGNVFTNATYARIVDAFPLFLTPSIVFRDSTYGQLLRYTPRPEYFKNFKLPVIQRETQLKLKGIGLTPAERSYIAQNDYEWTIELPSWIKDRLENTYRMQNIDSPIIIEIDIAPMEDLYQTDATAVTGNLQLTLLLHGRTPTEAERDETSAVINSTSGQLMETRDSYECNAGIIPAGFQGTMSLDVSAIKGPITGYDVCFQIESNLTSNYNKDFTNFPNSIKPDFIEGKTGNLNYIQQIRTIEWLGDLQAKYFPNTAPQTLSLQLPFADFPEKWRFMHTGYLDHTFLGKPLVWVTYLNPVPFNIRVTVIAWRPAWIQHQAGRIQAVLVQ